MNHTPYNRKRRDQLSRDEEQRAENSPEVPFSLGVTVGVPGLLGSQCLRLQPSLFPHLPEKAGSDILSQNAQPAFPLGNQLK